LSQLIKPNSYFRFCRQYGRQLQRLCAVALCFAAMSPASKRNAPTRLRVASAPRQSGAATDEAQSEVRELVTPERIRPVEILESTAIPAS